MKQQDPKDELALRREQITTAFLEQSAATVTLLRRLNGAGEKAAKDLEQEPVTTPAEKASHDQT